MSDEDRTRWNQRFLDGAYRGRTHPSTFLQDFEGLLRSPSNVSALDIACGAGRNTRFLCELGYTVTAIDVSGVALQRLQADASAYHSLRTIEHDLDNGLPVLNDRFSAIAVIRFLKLELIIELRRLLASDGLLLCEVLLQNPMHTNPSHALATQANPAAGPAAGPAESRFRAAPGALRKAAEGMEVLHYYEGEVVDPDGKSARIAQLVARNKV